MIGVGKAALSDKAEKPVALVGLSLIDSTGSRLEDVDARTDSCERVVLIIVL